jgi:hypothetical protein
MAAGPDQLHGTHWRIYSEVKPTRTGAVREVYGGGREYVVRGPHFVLGVHGA